MIWCPFGFAEKWVFKILGKRSSYVWLKRLTILLLILSQNYNLFLICLMKIDFVGKFRKKTTTKTRLIAVFEFVFGKLIFWKYRKKTKTRFIGSLKLYYENWYIRFLGKKLRREKKTKTRLKMWVNLFFLWKMFYKKLGNNQNQDRIYRCFEIVLWKLYHWIIRRKSKLRQG